MLTELEIRNADLVLGEYNLKWLLVQEIGLEATKEVCSKLAQYLTDMQYETEPKGGWDEEESLAFIHPQYRVLHKGDGLFVAVISPANNWQGVLINAV